LTWRCWQLYSSRLEPKSERGASQRLTRALTLMIYTQRYASSIAQAVLC
jgi:hypothetical protein